MKLTTIAVLALAALAACGTPAPEPPTLSQFETLDRPSAQAMYAALAPNEQAALWRAKLTRELAQPRSPEATALIREVRDHVVEILTDPVASARYHGRATQVLGEGEVDAVFGSFEHVAAFDDVIDPGGGGTCSDRWSCSDACGCRHPTRGYDCEQHTCDRTCTPTESGCGWFWSQACTGIASSTTVSSC